MGKKVYAKSDDFYKRKNFDVTLNLILGFSTLASLSNQDSYLRKHGPKKKKKKKKKKKR